MFASPRFHRLLACLLLLACLSPGPAMHAADPGADPGADPAQQEQQLYLPLAANVRQVIPLELDVRQPVLAAGNSVVVFVGTDDAGGVDVYSLHLSPPQSLENLTNTPDVVEETPLIIPNSLGLIYAARDERSWNLYLRDLYGGAVRLLVQDSGADEVHPSLSADGAQLLFASNRAGGNWDIYSARWGNGLPAVPVRLTTDAAVERFPVGAQGNAIVFRREQEGANGVQSRLYVMAGDGSGVQPLTAGDGYFTYPAATPAHAGIVYLSGSAAGSSGALLAANLGGNAARPLVAAAAAPRLSHDGTRLVYTTASGDKSAIVIETFPDPLLQVGRAGYARLTQECSWENGVMATGWVKAWRATGDAQYAAWVRSWVDGCLQRGATIAHANDVPLAYAALALYAATPDPRYWALAERAAAYIFEEAPRAPDGTILHLDDMVWDDTLIGITPFLLSMYAATEEPRYLDEAVDQVLKHSAHLQDPATGLYHHAWRPATDSLDGPAFWGRGNGWVLLAVSELVAGMPRGHALLPAVQDVFTRHAAGLVAHQDSSGRWRTVITRPDAYLETSASALIAGALATALRYGELDRAQYEAPAAAALAGVWSQVDAGGIVGGVSTPTWPMPEDEYLERPISSFERYGQGVVLLMGAAFAQDFID